MKVGIAASNEQKLELIAKGIADTVITSWFANTAELLQSDAEFLIDCTFAGTQLPVIDRPFLVHAPVHTLAHLQAKGHVARFCAWNTFINRDIWEIAVAAGSNPDWLCTKMNKIKWPFLITQDEPGLIAPRIVCNIINEAYYALHAGVSSKEEIDLAMKLGTNYPYGPFEWSEKIGIRYINDLLQELSNKNKIYIPVIKDKL